MRSHWCPRSRSGRPARPAPGVGSRRSRPRAATGRCRPRRPAPRAPGSRPRSAMAFASGHHGARRRSAPDPGPAVTGAEASRGTLVRTVSARRRRSGPMPLPGRMRRRHPAPAIAAPPPPPATARPRVPSEPDAGIRAGARRGDGRGRPARRSAGGVAPCPRATTRIRRPSEDRQPGRRRERSRRRVAGHDRQALVVVSASRDSSRKLIRDVATREPYGRTTAIRGASTSRIRVAAEVISSSTSR